MFRSTSFAVGLLFSLLIAWSFDDYSEKSSSYLAWVLWLPLFWIFPTFTLLYVCSVNQWADFMSPKCIILLSAASKIKVSQYCGS